MVPQQLIKKLRECCPGYSASQLRQDLARRQLLRDWKLGEEEVDPVLAGQAFDILIREQENARFL